MAHLETDVLIVGAGAAGLYAAIAAGRSGASVLLIDKGVVGRGGATIMAQMTVAAAVGHEEPDDWTVHLADTLAAGRGLCDEALATLLCREGPARILEMDAWGVRWAKQGERLRQTAAPGHSRRRCCYIDFLNTGPAVAATLRHRAAATPGVRRISNLTVTDLVTRDGRVLGAVAVELVSGEPVTIAAKSVILATGGLTRIFQRNSASVNMTGDACALALWAGAELVDMEFVQFFPIGHLAPRLVGMDPIMWDPFRYKLGGRLLNGQFEEFIHRYGGSDHGTYSTARDQASYAILQEVASGRGSPHGGVYLDFRHVPEETLRAAFGPVIDRLLGNNIDLTRTPVEVSPIAHYHMGGIRVDEHMRTRVDGLYAAGEAVGGANGANRLSGNGITEALVFGDTAGRTAAAHASTIGSLVWADAAAAGPVAEALAIRDGRTGDGATPAALQVELQRLMSQKAGTFRTAEQLTEALDRVREMRRHDLPRARIAQVSPYRTDVHDWYDLRAMLLVSEAVVTAALARTESRGAHQRLDYPDTDTALARRQVIASLDGDMTLSWEGVPA